MRRVERARDARSMGVGYAGLGRGGRESARGTDHGRLADWAWLRKGSQTSVLRTRRGVRTMRVEKARAIGRVRYTCDASGGSPELRRKCDLEMARRMGSNMVQGPRIVAGSPLRETDDAADQPRPHAAAAATPRPPRHATHSRPRPKKRDHEYTRASSVSFGRRFVSLALSSSPPSLAQA